VLVLERAVAVAKAWVALADVMERLDLRFLTFEYAVRRFELHNFL
jgi:hypothetical protein